jgi:hypothetical protein
LTEVQQQQQGQQAEVSAEASLPHVPSPPMLLEMAVTPFQPEDMMAPLELVESDDLPG